MTMMMLVNGYKTDRGGGRYLLIFTSQITARVYKSHVLLNSTRGAGAGYFLFRLWIVLVLVAVEFMKKGNACM